MRKERLLGYLWLTYLVLWFFESAHRVNYAAFDPISLAIAVGSSLISSSITARQNRPKASQVSGLPTNNEQRSIPYIAGSVEIDAPALIDYGDFRTSSVRTEFPTWLNILMPITAIIDQLPFGYRVYMGLDFGLCHYASAGPVLKGIKYGDKQVWSGTATGGQTISVEAPGVFGREGGVYARCTFYDGSFTQASDSYWAARHSGSVPAYRGTSHFVWEGPSSSAPALGKIKHSGYIGRSATVRPFKFQLQRIPNNLGTTFSLVNGNEANFAEVIYELFTNEAVGLGMPTDSFDLPAWQAVAETLFDEGLGCSLKWDTAMEVGEMIALLKDTIDAEIFTSIDGVNAGKLTIKLIRQDYDVDDLPVVTITNASDVVRYEVTTPGVVPNEFKVNFTNISAGYVKAQAIFQSLASRNVSVSRDPVETEYPVGSATAAQKLVTRDALAAVLPLKSVEVKVTRDLYGLTPGQCFVFNWPEYGVEQLILRVKKPNLGSLLNPAVTIEAVEDRFSTGYSAYGVSSIRDVGDPTTPSLQEGIVWEVINNTTTAPPSDPSVGDSYIIASGATGDWSGHDGDLATWDGTIWQFQEGDDLDNKTVYNLDDGNYYYYTGGAWHLFVAGLTVREVDGSPSVAPTSYLEFTSPFTVADQTGEVARVDLRDGGVADVKLAERYVKADGTRAFTGDQSLGGFKLTNVADPVSGSDAVNKNYIDAVTSGFDFKGSCRAATTASISLSAPQTIDGVSVIAGDRVLVKNQSTGADNGIYVCASGSWSRSTDADTSAEVTAGMLVAITEGSVNADTLWLLTTNDTITLGSTSLTFAQYGVTNTGSAVTVNAQTGTTYTLQSTDNGALVTCDNASAITVTVPSGLGLGFNCMIFQKNSGQVTLSASSTTLNNRQGQLKTAGQYAMISLAAYVSDIFMIGGDVGA